MHPLLLFEALTTNAVQMEGVTLSDPVCQEQLLAYQKNMQLVRAAIAVPAFSAKITVVGAEAGTKSAREVFGPNYVKRLDSSPDLSSKKHNQFSKKLAVMIRRTGKYMRRIIDKDNPLSLESLEGYTKQLEQHVVCSGEFVHGMFEGALKAMCIQAWTALEVLIEDLHSKVVDKNRAYFTEDALDKHDRWKSDSKGGFGFRSRPRFQYAYQTTFAFDAEIDSILKHPAINALVAVRNILVHRGGVVDDDFLKKDLPLAPHLSRVFPLIAEDKPLEFDGARVREIISDAAFQGYKLIREVDRWICSNHPKN